jgi:predicted anti-sigma-YlaC factor YlaD
MVIEISCRAIRKPTNAAQNPYPSKSKAEAMTAKRVLLAGMMVVLAIVAIIAWIAWTNGSLGTAHIIGLGASVLLLVLIWFWPGSRQPTQPPP